MSAECHLVLQERLIPPSEEWRHCTHSWTAVRMASGFGYSLGGGSAREMKPGDTMIAGPEVKVILRASQLGELKIEFFTIEPQLLNGLFTVIEWHQLEHMSGSEAPQRLMQGLFYSASEPLAQKFARLAALSHRDTLPARLAFLQLWASCLTSLLPAYSPAGTGPRKLRQQFRDFFSRLSEKELATSSLTDMALELNCSERHFSRMFREEFGIPLRDCQNELRLQRAARLLSDFKVKISSVASECGYRHLGLFNIMFKKRFAMTPSQWRRQRIQGQSTAERASSSLSPQPAGHGAATTAVAEKIRANLTIAFDKNKPARPVRDRQKTA